MHFTAVGYKGGLAAVICLLAPYRSASYIF